VRDLDPAGNQGQFAPKPPLSSRAAQRLRPQQNGGRRPRVTGAGRGKRGTEWTIDPRILNRRICHRACIHCFDVCGPPGAGSTASGRRDGGPLRMTAGQVAGPSEITLSMPGFNRKESRSSSPRSLTGKDRTARPPPPRTSAALGCSPRRVGQSASRFVQTKGSPVPPTQSDRPTKIQTNGAGAQLPSPNGARFLGDTRPSLPRVFRGKSSSRSSSTRTSPFFSFNDTKPILRIQSWVSGPPRKLKGTNRPRNFESQEDPARATILVGHRTNNFRRGGIERVRSDSWVSQPYSNDQVIITPSGLQP